MSLIREVIQPALADLELLFQAADEAILVRFASEGVAYDVLIHEVARPPLVWLRFHPHLYLQPKRDDALIATALGGNYQRYLVKAGRDPRDGELIFDAEIPLYAPLTRAAFAAFFIAAVRHVEDMLACLARVRWAGLQPAEALGLGARVASTLPQEPPPASAGPQSELERLVAELLEESEPPADQQ